MAEDLRGSLVNSPSRETLPFDPASAAIAIVTFNRSGLLTRLLTSITAMDPRPGHVVVIDNASTDDTADVVESFRGSIAPSVLASCHG